MLHILDRNQNIIGRLDNSHPASLPYFDDVRTETLVDGYLSLQFNTMANHEHSNLLQNEGGILRRKDRANEDGVFEYEMFRIKDMTDHRTSGTLHRTVYCENMVVTELLGHIVRPVKFEDANLDDVVNAILAGSSWSTGVSEGTESRTLEFTRHTTALQAIRQVAAAYGVEVEFGIELVNQTEIRHKWVHLRHQRGNMNLRTRFVYGENLAGVTRQENTENIITALIGVGRGDEDGVPMNIGTADTSIIDNDPDLQLLGDAVISLSALERWGINGNHITGVFYDNQAEDPTQLLHNTVAELQRINDSLFTYTVQAAMINRLEGYENRTVEIGDTIVVQDKTFNPPLLLEARIIDLQTSESNPELDQCVLGHFIPFLNTVNQNIIDIQNIIREREDQWNSQGDRIEDLEDQVADLEDQIGDIDFPDVDFGEIEDQIRDLEDKIRDLESQLEDLDNEQQIGELEDLILDLEEQLRYLENQLEDLDFDFEIGARNYFRESFLLTEEMWRTSGVGASRELPDEEFGGGATVIRLENNTGWIGQDTEIIGFDFSDSRRSFTVSLFARGTAAGQTIGLTLSGEHANFEPQALSTEWERYVWTFEGIGMSLVTFRPFVNGASAANPIFWQRPQLEFATLPSDFNPSPDDTDDRITDVVDRLSQVEVLIEDDRIVGTILQHVNFLEWASSKVDVDDLEETMTNLGQQLEQMEADFNRDIDYALESANNFTSERVAEVQLEVNNLNVNFRKAGGVNYLRNSIGLADFDFWNSGARVTRIQTTEQDMGSTHGWRFTPIAQEGGANHWQDIPTTVGVEYTLSFRINKPNAQGGFTANVSPYPLMTAADNIAFMNFNNVQTNGFEEFYLTFRAVTTRTVIRFHVGTNANSQHTIDLTSIMVNIGTIPFTWTMHPQEIYSTDVRFDINGIRVENSNHNGHTIMSASEFAGYYDVHGTGRLEDRERVFQVNEDAFQMRRAIVEEEIHLHPVRMIPITSGGHMGIAFVSSADRSEPIAKPIPAPKPIEPNKGT